MSDELRAAAERLRKWFGLAKGRPTQAEYDIYPDADGYADLIHRNLVDKELLARHYLATTREDDGEADNRGLAAARVMADAVLAANGRAK